MWDQGVSFSSDGDSTSDRDSTTRPSYNYSLPVEGTAELSVINLETLHGGRHTVLPLALTANTIQGGLLNMTNTLT